jgi:hypothetical protein
MDKTQITGKLFWKTDFHSVVKTRIFTWINEATRNNIFYKNFCLRSRTSASGHCVQPGRVHFISSPALRCCKKTGGEVRPNEADVGHNVGVYKNGLKPTFCR